MTVAPEVAYYPSMDRSSPSAAESVSAVAAALDPRAAEMSADIYGLIVREIPLLRSDKRVLALLESSVAENVATVLHILQHSIDLEKVRAPAAAEEYARRLAQRGVPIAALLRAYRIGSARFEDWCLQELGRQTDNASIVSAAGLRIARGLASYIDQVSEELVSAYESEKENWLRNQSAARAARVRALLRGEQADVSSSEAMLGYRLRQHHLGVVTWITGASGGGDALGRLEHVTAEVAAEVRCEGKPIFIPQDVLPRAPEVAYYPSMDRSSPSAAESVSAVAAALDPRAAEMSADIYGLIVREIPLLRSDKRVLALLESSVAENVATVLHILQHSIDLEKVRAPAAAEEYARRLAQRGVPIAALLRAYRIGSARFEDWCLQELGRQTDNASIVSAAGLRIARGLASYIDQVSEELVSAYESEKENWLRNQSAARAARVRALLRGEQADVSSSEAMLGYRLRQHHLGVVTWITGASGGGDALGRLEHVTAEVAAEVRCEGKPIFIPQDEFSAWAWLPLGARRDIALPGLDVKGIIAEDRIRFAFGEPALGLPGFRRTHQQALSAQAVALAAGPSGQLVTSFGEVAPLALMSGSIELLQAWVAETLGALADDDEHNARLRDTLRIFLQENGSYKTTAERLMLHKNTVQYRVRKAEETLRRPIGPDRLQIELALLASHSLGRTVLRPVGEPGTGAISPPAR